MIDSDANGQGPVTDENFEQRLSEMLGIDLDAPQPIPNPPTNAELLTADIPSAAPTIEDMALAVGKADRALKEGLHKLGLSEKEVEQAQALQQFNRGHFADSMDMISAHVLKTSLKLGVQQTEIEERLEVCRKVIKEHGEFSSIERAQWVEEERLLVLQYRDIGNLLQKIHEGWYKGAAHLAMIRARYAGRPPGEKNITSPNKKPGFRPRVVQAQVEPT
jgi:hypothetical protein